MSATVPVSFVDNVCQHLRAGFGAITVPTMDESNAIAGLTAATHKLREIWKQMAKKSERQFRGARAKMRAKESDAWVGFKDTGDWIAQKVVDGERVVRCRVGKCRSPGNNSGYCTKHRSGRRKSMMDTSPPIPGRCNWFSPAKQGTGLRHGKRCGVRVSLDRPCPFHKNAPTFDPEVF